MSSTNQIRPHKQICYVDGLRNTSQNSLPNLHTVKNMASGSPDISTENLKLKKENLMLHQELNRFRCQYENIKLELQKLYQLNMHLMDQINRYQHAFENNLPKNVDLSAIVISWRFREPYNCGQPTAAMRQSQSYNKMLVGGKSRCSDPCCPDPNCQGSNVWTPFHDGRYNSGQKPGTSDCQQQFIPRNSQLGSPVGPLVSHMSQQMISSDSGIVRVQHYQQMNVSNTLNVQRLTGRMPVSASKQQFENQPCSYLTDNSSVDSCQGGNATIIKSLLQPQSVSLPPILSHHPLDGVNPALCENSVNNQRNLVLPPPARPDTLYPSPIVHQGISPPIIRPLSYHHDNPRFPFVNNSPLNRMAAMSDYRLPMHDTMMHRPLSPTKLHNDMPPHGQPLRLAFDMSNAVGGRQNRMFDDRMSTNTVSNVTEVGTYMHRNIDSYKFIEPKLVQDHSQSANSTNSLQSMSLSVYSREPVGHPSPSWKTTNDSEQVDILAKAAEALFSPCDGQQLMMEDNEEDNGLFSTSYSEISDNVMLVPNSIGVSEPPVVNGTSYKQNAMVQSSCDNYMEGIQPKPGGMLQLLVLNDDGYLENAGEVTSGSIEGRATCPVEYCQVDDTSTNSETLFSPARNVNDDNIPVAQTHCDITNILSTQVTEPTVTSSNSIHNTDQSESDVMCVVSLTEPNVDNMPSNESCDTCSTVTGQLSSIETDGSDSGIVRFTMSDLYAMVDKIENMESCKRPYDCMLDDDHEYDIERKRRKMDNDQELEDVMSNNDQELDVVVSNNDQELDVVMSNNDQELEEVIINNDQKVDVVSSNDQELEDISKTIIINNVREAEVVGDTPVCNKSTMFEESNKKSSGQKSTLFPVENDINSKNDKCDSNVYDTVNTDDDSCDEHDEDDIVISSCISIQVLQDVNNPVINKESLLSTVCDIRTPAVDENLILNDEVARKSPAALLKEKSNGKSPVAIVDSLLSEESCRNAESVVVNVDCVVFEKSQSAIIACPTDVSHPGETNANSIYDFIDNENDGDNNNADSDDNEDEEVDVDVGDVDADVVIQCETTKSQINPEFNVPIINHVSRQSGVHKEFSFSRETDDNDSEENFEDSDDGNVGVCVCDGNVCVCVCDGNVVGGNSAVDVATVLHENNNYQLTVVGSDLVIEPNRVVGVSKVSVELTDNSAAGQDISDVVRNDEAMHTDRDSLLPCDLCEQPPTIFSECITVGDNLKNTVLCVPSEITVETNPQSHAVISEKYSEDSVVGFHQGESNGIDCQQVGESNVSNIEDSCVSNNVDMTSLTDNVRVSDERDLIIKSNDSLKVEQTSGNCANEVEQDSIIDTNDSFIITQESDYNDCQNVNIDQVSVTVNVKKCTMQANKPEPAGEEFGLRYDDTDFNVSMENDIDASEQSESGLCMNVIELSSDNKNCLDSFTTVNYLDNSSITNHCNTQSRTLCEVNVTNTSSFMNDGTSSVSKSPAHLTDNNQQCVWDSLLIQSKISVDDSAATRNIGVSCVDNINGMLNSVISDEVNSRDDVVGNSATSSLSSASRNCFDFLNQLTSTRDRKPLTALKTRSGLNQKKPSVGLKMKFKLSYDNERISKIEIDNSLCHQVSVKDSEHCHSRFSGDTSQVELNKLDFSQKVVGVRDLFLSASLNRSFTSQSSILSCLSAETCHTTKSALTEEDSLGWDDSETKEACDIEDSCNILISQSDIPSADNADRIATVIDSTLSLPSEDSSIEMPDLTASNVAVLQQSNSDSSWEYCPTLDDCSNIVNDNSENILFGHCDDSKFNDDILLAQHHCTDCVVELCSLEGQRTDSHCPQKMQPPDVASSSCTTERNVKSCVRH